jgi:hypothetical protein
LRGRRGGSILVTAGGVGSQYWVEKGSMDFMVWSGSVSISFHAIHQSETRSTY